MLIPIVSNELIIATSVFADIGVIIPVITNVNGEVVEVIPVILITDKVEDMQDPYVQLKPIGIVNEFGIVT